MKRITVEERAKEVLHVAEVKAQAVLDLAAATANTQSAVIATINSDIAYIKKDIADIKAKLENHYVTQDQFAPIAKIVYGMVSVILLTVLGAVIALVIIRK